MADPHRSSCKTRTRAPFTHPKGSTCRGDHHELACRYLLGVEAWALSPTEAAAWRWPYIPSSNYSSSSNPSRHGYLLVRWQPGTTSIVRQTMFSDAMNTMPAPGDQLLLHQRAQPSRLLPAIGCPGADRRWRHQRVTPSTITTPSPRSSLSQISPMRMRWRWHEDAENNVFLEELGIERNSSDGRNIEDVESRPMRTLVGWLQLLGLLRSLELLLVSVSQHELNDETT
jgi:hypothetical protein